MGTNLHTARTNSTALTIPYNPILHSDGVMRAALNTPATSFASITEIGDLGIHFLRFGIMAPYASQRTPLEEDGGANTGTIVYRIVMNIEYDASYLVHSMLCSVLSIISFCISQPRSTK